MSRDWWIELAELKSGRTKMEKTISKLRSKLSMLESENNNLKEFMNWLEVDKDWERCWESIMEEWKAQKEGSDENR